MGDGVVLILQSCTLRRFHPSLPRGKEVMATASSKEEWFALVEKHFLLTLEDLTLPDRNALWKKVLADHKAWAANKTASDAKKPETESAPLSLKQHSAGGPLPSGVVVMPPPQAMDLGRGRTFGNASGDRPKQRKGSWCMPGETCGRNRYSSSGEYLKQRRRNTHWI